MSDRPLREMAEGYADTATKLRKFGGGQTRQDALRIAEADERTAAILRAADACVETLRAMHPCQCETPCKVCDAVAGYEAACRQGKEHE